MVSIFIEGLGGLVFLCVLLARWANLCLRLRLHGCWETWAKQLMLVAPDPIFPHADWLPRITYPPPGLDQRNPRLEQPWNSVQMWNIIDKPTNCHSCKSTRGGRWMRTTLTGSWESWESWGEREREEEESHIHMGWCMDGCMAGSMGMGVVVGFIWMYMQFLHIMHAKRHTLTQTKQHTAILQMLASTKSCFFFWLLYIFSFQKVMFSVWDISQYQRDNVMLLSCQIVRFFIS